MEPKIKPDQHPLKNQGDPRENPEQPRKDTGTPPLPQSNPDHSVPDVQADDRRSVQHDEGDLRSGVSESPRATTENAPGPNEQQQG